jgi:hypothetical protein
MNNLGSLFGPAWALPAVALTVAAAALALGRRLLHRAPAARASPEPDLDEALCGVNRERRKIPRRKGGCAEAELADGAGGPPLYAWVLDRSAGGLCLLLDRPLAAGAALNVRPRCGEPLPWSAATVRSSKAAQGGWEAHVQFDRTPSWNVLALFG